MSEPKEYIPAFPQVNYHRPDGIGASVMEIRAGMSLRDYFAAQAMSGYCSNADSKNWSPTGIAQDAYAVADAMLFERLVEEVQ